MRGRDFADADPFAANQNNEGLTLRAIERNPWNAVDRPLPEDADRTLLERAAFAARECAKAAFAASRVAEIAEPDLAMSYERRRTEAADRDKEARRQLGRLSAEEVSKVSPFLDREEVHTKALRNVRIEVMIEQRPLRETITDARIDVNPWSIIRSDLTSAAPELLRRVQDTARGLVLDAWERRDQFYTPEEASLWNRYANAARSTYAEAECELAIAGGMKLDGPDLVPETLTREAIARNPRDAVELDIPPDASRELLSLIAATAEDLGRIAEHRAELAVREEDEVELHILSGEAKQRQQEAEARLAALDERAEEPPLRERVETPAEAGLDKDQAALIDMIGEAAYRAVNEPVPHRADAQTLERLSDDLDVALDHLDALNRSSHATGISPQYIAEQFEKAGVQQEEVEARLEDVNWDIDRTRSGIDAGGSDEAARSESIYDRYPGLTRDDSEDERDRDDGRSR